MPDASSTTSKWAEVTIRMDADRTANTAEVTYSARTIATPEGRSVGLRTRQAKNAVASLVDHIQRVVLADEAAAVLGDKLGVSVEDLGL